MTLSAFKDVVTSLRVLGYRNMREDRVTTLGEVDVLFYSFRKCDVEDWSAVLKLMSYSTCSPFKLGIIEVRVANLTMADLRYLEGLRKCRHVVWGVRVSGTT